jgi:cyclopropane fatty-acyl-phospholipid synthase-like methyltransferase
VHLAEGKQFSGSVLDLGCGTGKNALYLASLGHETWGVDSSLNAIAKAKKKAEERRIEVRFLVRDALELGDLGRTFDNVIDTGLFHTFSDEERPLYALTIASALRHGGKYYMLCFSDHETNLIGPKHVSQREIKATFGNGWKINYIRAARFDDNIHRDGAKAWLSSITRE